MTKPSNQYSKKNDTRHHQKFTPPRLQKKTDSPQPSREVGLALPEIVNYDFVDTDTPKHVSDELTDPDNPFAIYHNDRLTQKHPHRLCLFGREKQRLPQQANCHSRQVTPNF